MKTIRAFASAIFITAAWCFPAHAQNISDIESFLVGLGYKKLEKIEVNIAHSATFKSSGTHTDVTTFPLHFGEYFTLGRDESGAKGMESRVEFRPLATCRKYNSQVRGAFIFGEDGSRELLSGDSCSAYLKPDFLMLSSITIDGFESQSQSTFLKPGQRLLIFEHTDKQIPKQYFIFKTTPDRAAK